MPDVRTTTGQLSNYRIDDGQDVAVICLDQFTRIERSILPEEYDSYDLFTDEEFEMPPFHIFDSPAEIVDALLDTVTEEKAENVAVVLDSGSEYSSLVESAFETAGIPFYGGPEFIDDPNHRAFLSLLRAGFRGSNTTVRDLRPLLSQLDVEVDTEHDEKRLDVIDMPELEWLEGLRARIREITLAEVLDEYEQRADVSLAAFRDELARLGISDEKVTSDRIDDLAFYLERYEVPVDRENEGILLADAKSSGYVDRPVVFYLGIDDGWTHSAPQRPWIDTERQFERDVSQFQLMLQSGEEQYYLVQDTSGGQPVTPCLYFSELLDEEFERFSDLPSVKHTRTLNDGSDGFERSEEVSVEPETVDTISQSSLNSYVNSPRDYLFGKLVDSPDKDYFEEGTLFHDFAERYALGEDVTPSNEHEERVRRFIDGLEGELYVEEGITLPVTVDGDRYTVSGVADLVHVLGDSAEIVDYKTDQTRRAHDEYRKQASVYYHVVADAFPDKEVSASLFYTEDDEVVTVEPLSLGELKRLVREA